MRVPTRLAAPMVAACAMVALTANAASAGTTTIREETATGAPYSGNWRLSTVGPLNFQVTFLGAKVTAVCDGANLTGTVTSAGSGELTDASVGACTTSNGLSSPAATLENLPDNTGQVTYAPVQGGRDGTLAINGDLTFKLEGEFLGQIHTCYYGFRTGSTDGLSFDVYNRDNPNRPIPNDDAQGQIKDVTLVKLPQSDFICASDGTGNGNAVARGESTPGSGVFDRKLYLSS